MKLVAMMIMRNEAQRYLGVVLKEVTSYVDETVILDDASTDDSVKVAKFYPNTIVFESKISRFRDQQNILRGELLDRACERKPDWILALDADEVFEKRFKEGVKGMLETPFDWFQFICCRMWSSTHYILPGGRSRALKRLFRLSAITDKGFANMPKHCGSVPGCILPNKNGKVTDLRFKHLGFLRKEDRLKRIEDNRYFVNHQGHKTWFRYLERIERYEVNTPDLEEFKE